MGITDWFRGTSCVDACVVIVLNGIRDSGIADDVADLSRDVWDIEEYPLTIGETAEVVLPVRLPCPRESCEDKLDVFGVLVADFESVIVVDALTVVVTDSGEVFFGEYHCGVFLTGNALELSVVNDDDSCVVVVFGSKEETDDVDVPLTCAPVALVVGVTLLTGAGGGGCDGGPVVATGFGGSGISLLPPKMLLKPLIEPPRCCFFF